MTYDNRTYLKAQCEFTLTEEEFEEYVFLSDFMSKKKRMAQLLCGSLIAVVVTIGLHIFAGIPVFPLIFFLCVFGIAAAALIVSLVAKKPTFWFLQYQKRFIMRIYEEALHVSLSSDGMIYRFMLTKNAILFRIDDYELMRSLNDVRWISQKGDLVLIGCIDGSKSLSGTYVAGGGDHYKAVPAAAFLKSKLEGMDPDELIALLKEYAKKPKRPLPRKDAWK